MESFNPHKHITLSFYLTADQIKQIRALVFNTPVSSPLFPLHLILILFFFFSFFIFEKETPPKSLLRKRAWFIITEDVRPFLAGRCMTFCFA